MFIASLFWYVIKQRVLSAFFTYVSILLLNWLCCFTALCPSVHLFVGIVYPRFRLLEFVWQRWLFIYNPLPSCLALWMVNSWCIMYKILCIHLLMTISTYWLLTVSSLIRRRTTCLELAASYSPWMGNVLCPIAVFISVKEMSGYRLLLVCAVFVSLITLKQHINFYIKKN